MTGQPLLTFLLPGLDGTGILFRRFVDASNGALELRVLKYPTDRFLAYSRLEDVVSREFPTDRPFALLGESFGGPLALRLAAQLPTGLVGVVLAASFHRNPAPRWIRRLRPLAPAFFRLPLPDHAVRLLLGGKDAPLELVRDVQRSVAQVKGRVMALRAREALRVDATDALRRVQVPMLFLGGARDRLLRSALPSEFAAVRPDVQIRMLPAPHLTLQRMPAEAMRIVEEFLLAAERARQAPGAAALRSA